MSSWTDCGWWLYQRAWRRPGRERNRSLRRTKTTRVRRRAADREFIDKIAERLERKGRFDLVWARDRSNRRNADLGGSKV